ncbi:hypothetical protein D3C87_475570 [compost metagenome]
MADEIDMASAQEAMTLQRALDAQKARAASTPRPLARGFCLNIRCGEDFPPGDQRLFCGSHCEAEHKRFSNH